jgi:nucleotidyltransferase substrate binding protein (TIGR01987 family)
MSDNMIRMKDNTRARQRFDNFKRAFEQLKKATSQESYSDLEAAGLVQMFEFTFELGWKTMKDYLEEGGSDVATPREVIKAAFKENIIENGDVWIDALDKRNIMSHLYSDARSKEVIQLVRTSYLPVLQHFYESFNSRL